MFMTRQSPSQAFGYVMDAPNFSMADKYSNLLAGSLAMWAAQGKIKKKVGHALTASIACTEIKMRRFPGDARAHKLFSALFLGRFECFRTLYVHSSLQSTAQTTFSLLIAKFSPFPRAHSLWSRAVTEFFSHALLSTTLPTSERR